MFTEYRKIHIVVIAKLGINIYIHTDRLCWERGNIHCVRPLGRMHTILVIIIIVIIIIIGVCGEAKEQCVHLNIHQMT